MEHQAQMDNVNYGKRGGFFFAVLWRLFVVPVLYDTFARAAERLHRSRENESSIAG
jgi:hypothetical protein